MPVLLHVRKSASASHGGKRWQESIEFQQLSHRQFLGTPPFPQCERTGPFLERSPLTKAAMAGANRCKSKVPGAIVVGALCAPDGTPDGSNEVERAAALPPDSVSLPSRRPDRIRGLRSPSSSRPNGRNSHHHGGMIRQPVTRARSSTRSACRAAARRSSVNAPSICPRN